MRSTNNAQEAQKISKQIKKAIRAAKREDRRQRVESIVERYKDLKKISGIKSSKEKDFIISMTAEDGQEEKDRQSIANIFASFYESLYSAAQNDKLAKDATKSSLEAKNESTIEPFTMQEIRTALKQLKNGRSRWYSHFSLQVNFSLHLWAICRFVPHCITIRRS